MPKGFESIWEVFCSPHEYRCQEEIKCERCVTEYTVFFKQDYRRSIPFYEVGRDESYGMFREKHIRVYCPNCGSPLINFFAGIKLIAIHEQKNIHKG